MRMLLLFILIIGAVFQHALAMLYQGLFMDLNVVMITAQGTNKSHFCMGTLISPSRILTTYTCVSNAFNILVQHNYDDNYETVMFIPPSNVVKCDLSHHGKGLMFNIAIIKLDVPIDSAKFGPRDLLKFPKSKESMKRQISRNLDFKYIVYGTTFSNDFSEYPSSGGIPMFQLTDPTTCKKYFKSHDKSNLREDEAHFINLKEQYCIFSTTENTICSEDEGSPVLAAIADRTTGVFFDLVLMGIINANDRDCSKIKDMSPLPENSKYTKIVPITDIMDWINEQLF